MPKAKDCLGFETFGKDVKEARKALNMTRKVLAEKVNIDQRYLANIELSGTIPSLPVLIDIIRICKLPMERYFQPEIVGKDSRQVERLINKIRLCPEEYLPIIEGAVDGALKAAQEKDK